jgi:hypothetical protein
VENSVILNLNNLDSKRKLKKYEPNSTFASVGKVFVAKVARNIGKVAKFLFHLKRIFWSTGGEVSREPGNTAALQRRRQVNLIRRTGERSL